MIFKILLVLAVIVDLWFTFSLIFSLISEKIMEKVEKKKEEKL